MPYILLLQLGHDSRAIDHMISNFSLFTIFESHPSTSIVTLENGSTSCVLRLATIHCTSLIPLTFVMSLPQFYFNFISTSKLTCTLNYSILFFPNYSVLGSFDEGGLLVDYVSPGVSTSLIHIF